MIRSSDAGKKKHSGALIIFTREPEEGRTKTRLMPYFSPAQCAELHRCMLKDISKEMQKADADIFVAYTCGDGPDDPGEPAFLRSIVKRNTVFIRQRGEDIGSRMRNAFDDVLGSGYSKAVLIGTDIPGIRSETIDSALELLDSTDVVMGPTEDGGYYLIGMKSVHPEAFDVRTYGVSTVFDETIASIRKAGLSAGLVSAYPDIDTPEDLAGFRRMMRRDPRLRRSYTGRFLAAGSGISVIVPVYNEASEIGRLTDQLMPYRNECEIIMVDGGSTDGTAELIADMTGTGRDESSIMLLKTAKGRAVQMNAGARASSGDILFFLHCDSTLPEKFTDEIRRVMSTYDWGFFRLRFPSRNFFMLTNRLVSNLRASCRRLPFGDQGIFIDRELFFEAGMFPEIPLMEDYEFSMKMRRRSGVRGPGPAAKTIMTSDRRYGTGTWSILRTEMHMWKLRYLYRRGVSSDRLLRMYRDIR